MVVVGRLGLRNQIQQAMSAAGKPRHFCVLADCGVPRPLQTGLSSDPARIIKAARRRVESRYMS